MSDESPSRPATPEEGDAAAERDRDEVPAPSRTEDRRVPAEQASISTRGELPWGLVFLLLLALLIVVFAVQNTQSVRIQFLVWETRSPLAVVIIAVVVATTIVVELLGLVFRRRRRKRLAERAELERLRKLRTGTGDPAG